MVYPMTESKFNMWRGTIALAYIDGEVSIDERNWLREHLQKIPFSDTQWEMLITDLEHGVELDKILPLVSDQKDRAHLLHFANQLFRKDGLVRIEETTYKKLEKEIMKGCDLMATVKKVEKTMAEREEKKEEDRGKLKGPFRTLIDYFKDN